MRRLLAALLLLAPATARAQQRVNPAIINETDPNGRGCAFLCYMQALAEGMAKNTSGRAQDLDLESIDLAGYKCATKCPAGDAALGCFLAETHRNACAAVSTGHFPELVCTMSEFMLVGQCCSLGFARPGTICKAAKSFDRFDAIPSAKRMKLIRKACDHL